MGQDLLQFYYQRTCYLWMLTRVWWKDMFLSTSAHSVCCFLACLGIFLWQGSRYFILLILGGKKECLLRVARVICDKKINSSSWSLYEKYDFPLCSKSSPTHVQKFAVLQTSTQRLRMTFHRWSLSTIIHHRYKGWYCPTKPPPSINLYLLVCIGCSSHAFYPSMVD